MTKPIDCAKRKTNLPQIQNGCPQGIYDFAGFACSIDISYKGKSPCTAEDYKRCPLNNKERTGIKVS